MAIDSTPDDRDKQLQKPTFASTLTQYTTFLVAGQLYGVPVMRVREVVRPLPITSIPLSEFYVHGLLNLRGQVVTAVGVHRLFGIGSPDPANLMNVICEKGSSLLSIQADEIGDVLEMDQSEIEPAPLTVLQGVKSYLSGVYKIPNSRLLSILDVDRVFAVVEKTTQGDQRQENDNV
jgi:purine-binding chemotaxis protein CheW